MQRKYFSPGPSRTSGARFRRPVSRRPARQVGAYINPAKFVNKAVLLEEQILEAAEHKFTDFGLSEALTRNVLARGYDQPTPIQDQAISVVLEGSDLVGLANTGTGKTAAFIIPIIQRLLTVDRGKTVLIMAPTRELANQIHAEFTDFARGLGLYAALCVGGVNIQRQISNLARRPQVVIGTPGRLKDLYNQGKLQLSSSKILVLDEADQMLDMGFIRDIRYLIDKLPTERQTLCFSATMSTEIQQLVSEFITKPVHISVRTRETSEQIDQDVINVESNEHRMAILSELLKQPEFEKVLIFGTTKHGVQRLADNLVKSGISAQAIHGNKSQPQRQRALQAFKDNQSQVLVATDVAARGLDIPNVSHVINYDLPQTYENYIHRIGRTGRAGKSGQALTFVVGR